jgi:outer membrane protease
MKKSITMMTMFLSCMLTVHALGNEYAAGIEAHAGVSGLRMAEMVYKDSSGSGLLSEIVWDMGAQMAAGAGFGIAPSDLFRKTGFSLGGNFLMFFPVNGRSMRDTDWDSNGNKYSYGESLASAIAGMEAEGRFAVYFPVFTQYLVEATAEVWYSRYAVVAHDGWVNWPDSDEKIPLYGAAVEYIQEWVLVAPGLGLRRKLNNAHIGVRAAVSPFIWGYHIDNHYFRTLESDDPDQKYLRYTDITKGGVFFLMQVGWFWDMTRRLQMGVTVNYRAIRNSRGDTTTATAGLAGYSFLDKGMAGAEAKTIGFEVTIRAAL